MEINSEQWWRQKFMLVPITPSPARSVGTFILGSPERNTVLQFKKSHETELVLCWSPLESSCFDRPTLQILRSSTRKIWCLSNRSGIQIQINCSFDTWKLCRIKIIFNSAEWRSCFVFYMSRIQAPATVSQCIPSLQVYTNHNLGWQLVTIQLFLEHVAWTLQFGTQHSKIRDTTFTDTTRKSVLYGHIFKLRSSCLQGTFVGCKRLM
jgi:hypothetical protein